MKDYCSRLVVGRRRVCRLRREVLGLRPSGRKRALRGVRSFDFHRVFRRRVAPEFYPVTAVAFGLIHRRIRIA